MMRSTSAIPAVIKLMIVKARSTNEAKPSLKLSKEELRILLRKIAKVMSRVKNS